MSPRPLNKIIIHCSGTPPDMDIGVEEIRKWHTDPPRNWDDIGYHLVIRRDGSCEEGRPVEIPGAHTRGHNKDSYGVCLVGGGGGKFDFNYRQIEALLAFIEVIKGRFPEIEIKGHNNYSNKACPCFDVEEFFKLRN